MSGSAQSQARCRCGRAAREGAYGRSCEQWPLCESAPDAAAFGGHVFVNVNEEGEPYQVSSNLDLALGMLAKYPNDTIVVRYADRPESRAGITLTRDQVEAWVGHELTDEQVAEIEDCIPNSSIPDAIGVIAHDALGIRGNAGEPLDDLCDGLDRCPDPQACSVCYEGP